MRAPIFSQFFLFGDVILWNTVSGYSMCTMSVMGDTLVTAPESAWPRKATEVGEACRTAVGNMQR